MKPKSPITFILGVFLFVLGVWSLTSYGGMGSIVPLLIGGALTYLSWRRSRTATLIFGQATIVIGYFLVTWGIYLLPPSQPTIGHILGRSLFWGFISIFGGLCANYHGFCACVR
ncbi:MAG: hypothetical protein ACPLRA_04885 [Candidatus Saccharicenans sp.]